ncbi:PREDICTED: uncharacterized protein LOC106813386 [Priapulus caudatus]|uniref:Uncharacterized protein LOC106813386 n=1 Tax=Priapulus caudatus TaxID=37621 RepID=A0ABM1ELD6_PRICU|nr:PREDICTED: uncharacterized protein LOC106813386 [Priapulus caudatus]
MYICGAVDGNSRLITFLDITCENSARNNCVFFLCGVQQYGLPSRVRVDDGGEYMEVRRYMEREMGQGRGSVIVGTSVHNQRIERMWRDVYAKVLAIYYRLFYHLEDHGILDLSSNIHLFALHYVFVQRIQQDLSRWAAAHNNHGLRTEHHQTPMQLWMSGIIQQSQSSSTAIRNALSFNIDAEVVREHHSLDWEEQSTRLNVPISHIHDPLPEERLIEMSQQINVMAECEDYGLGFYGRVVQFITTHSV